MGIQKFVFFSIHNCDKHPEVPLMEIKHCTEKFLRDSGLNHLTIRLCGFMQVNTWVSFTFSNNQKCFGVDLGSPPLNSSMVCVLTCELVSNLIIIKWSVGSVWLWKIFIFTLFIIFYYSIPSHPTHFSTLNIKLKYYLTILPETNAPNIFSSKHPSYGWTLHKNNKMIISY